MNPTATGKTTPLDRAIRSREKGIERMRVNIKRIRQEAEDAIALVEVRIQEKQILLDALKKGRMRK